jgi:hypothetical protein
VTRQSRQHYAEVARRLVRRFREEPGPSLPSDRRRLVGAVEQALHARARRNAQVRRAGWVVSGLVASVAALVIVPRLVPGGHDGSTARHAPRAFTVLGADTAAAMASIGGEAPVPVRNGMPLREGLRLVAPASGEVRVGTAEGTSLTLEPRGDLTVAEAGDTQRFALRAGAVRARVSRLFAGERFIVDTTDAEVEVRGTAFRVAVVAADPSCGAGTTTRVSVDEGVVTVRQGGREARLAPGEAWPAGCPVGLAAATAEPAPRITKTSTRTSTTPPSTPHPTRVARGVSHDHEPGERPAPAQAPVVAPVVAPAAPVAPPPTAVSASGLAAENDLFAAAVRARNEGRLAEAARMFARLCDDHPRSPLAESAAVQRMHVLAVIDPAQGARAAADYMARYPGGFARVDAQALIERAAP